MVTQVSCVGEWEQLKTLDKLEENPIITGGNAALSLEEMVFVCLKNLQYPSILLTQIWSLEGAHRMGEYQV